MQLDKASYYALMATVSIAHRAPHRPIQGRRVADECDLPFEYLLKILQQLTRSGILISERGRTGGFALAKAPEKITVLDIVEAIQGPIHRRGGGGGYKGRPIRPEQMVENLLADIAHYTRERLAGVTITDLMQAR